METNKLKNILLKVCDSLAKCDVDYMLIGGTAIALNGYYRDSTNASGKLTDKPDIDIWYDPTYTNYFNLLQALKELDYDISGFEKEQNPNPKKAFFKLEFDDFTFDLLPEIRAMLKDFQPLEFMRKKDIEDLEQLKKLRDKES